MKKGSPEGYNAETSVSALTQIPQTGEPNERYPLYRIRCPQENCQLLQQTSRRYDCRGGHDHCGTCCSQGVGHGAATTLARRDGSAAVQRLDLRPPKTLRSA